MLLSGPYLVHQEILKTALQAEKDAHKLEHLAAGLIGRLLGVPVAIAKSGSQHGADAGTAGQHDRRLRIECKKYADDTSLSDRELLGEIDHALARDQALEAWMLVATRVVTEQLAHDLIQKGEEVGIAISIIDWHETELSRLAALCTLDPAAVEATFSAEAGAAARALEPIAHETVAALQRDLQAWCLGFEALRSRSHKRLNAIWESSRTSNSALGQNAAGGAEPKKIRRRLVHENLTNWWNGPAKNDSPAAVLGWDGVGKTWATLDWLVDKKAELPVVLVIPSSSLTPGSVSESNLKELIAQRFYELTGVRNRAHWLRRLEKLLKRPPEEGPLLAVYFDGLNQEPSIQWGWLLKVLQGENFAGRIRIIVSTRQHHFEDKLSSLRSLAVPAARIVVDVYETAPGGELDQMLAFEGLKQTDLHPDLIELARTPRLFKLVVRFRENLVEAEQVTVHRLLWEYGRDTFGDRAEKSFSEVEWRAWLAEIAERYRKGVQTYSLRTLGETAHRPGLTDREVYARLSDIIDGQFTEKDAFGNIYFTPTVVSHSLGMALLSHLETLNATTIAELEPEVNAWLDPISGLDQRAEIMRAAVSIFIERGEPAASPVAGVLVTAWLQSQNVTDSHRRELASLAPNIPSALLDAVEHSNGYAQASARLWAVNALRQIPRDNDSALGAIVGRLCTWLSVVSRDVIRHVDADPAFEKRRAEQLINKIGVDKSGPITVLGIVLHLVEHDDGRLQATIPSIIEGFPIAKALPCFETAAVASAVRGHGDCWSGLRWLCYLNEVDPGPAADALRGLSATVRARTPEPGVHPLLADRAAALILYLTGHTDDEEMAVTIDPRIDRTYTYENDYLPHPGRSFFALERRHAAAALNDRGISFYARLQRTEELWLDPTFEAPSEFIAEVRTGAESFEMAKLDRQAGHTQEDLFFEALEPVLARCAPDLLTELISRKLQSLSTCSPQSRYWAATHATNHFILADSAAASAAETLRLSSRETEKNQEGAAAADLMKIELRHIPDVQGQFDKLIEADLNFIPADFSEVMLIPTESDVDALIGRHHNDTEKQRRDLVVLLSVHPTTFSESAWDWLVEFASRSDHDLKHVLFRMLARCDEQRFGRMLAANDWSWQPGAHLWVNHYGTGALMSAAGALPFDQLAPRLAPWRLLEAARMRGADPADVHLAAEIFGRILLADKIEEPDPGSDLTIDRTEKEFAPFSFSAKMRADSEERANPLRALDLEASAKAYVRAYETAVARVEEARKLGASLYLTEVTSADMMPVLEYAPEMIDRWIEGYREHTVDFRRRVHLAETTFLAICEALLARSPEKGAELWRALRETVATKYVGAAGVNELVDMVFRAPSSAAVSELQSEVMALSRCYTDHALFDVAVAASCNDKADWVGQVAADDSASPLVWRQKRGALFAGLTVGNDTPIPGAWPEGEIRTSHADLSIKAAKLQWREACAHHWWRTYLAAPDRAAAYAAWVLFIRSADRRAWAWLREDASAADDKSPFFALKLAHFQLNRPEFKREMGKRLDKGDRQFLGDDIVKGVGPWGQMD